MVELHTSPSRLELDRLECLDSIHRALCVPAASTDAAQSWERTADGVVPAAQSGWQLVSHRSSPHWLRLFHSELQILLDVQASYLPVQINTHPHHARLAPPPQCMFGAWPAAHVSSTLQQQVLSLCAGHLQQAQAA